MRLGYESAAADLANDEPAALEVAERSANRIAADRVLPGQFPLRGQPGAGPPGPGIDFLGEGLKKLF